MMAGRSQTSDRPSISDRKPLYRRCQCNECGRETWHRYAGRDHWACACGDVRVERVWTTTRLSPRTRLGAVSGH